MTDTHTHGDRSGETYNPHRDKARLNRQASKVFNLMRDSNWRTLAQIAMALCEPEASISARLRDLRKTRFGGHIVERESVVGGLYRYRLIVVEAAE